MNKPILTIAALLPVFCLFFTGCAKEMPPVQYYRIEMDISGLKTAIRPVYESLKVTVRGADNSIYYTNEQYGKNAFKFSRWSQSPNEMLKNKIINAIQKSGLATHVLSPASHGTAQYLLEIEIEDLSMHIQQDKTGEGILIISASLLETRHSRVVKSGSLRCSSPALEVNPQTAVNAINNASNTCTQKLVEWLQE
jgi:ABC-type uncharacterized transport system auxiliary subunit